MAVLEVAGVLLLTVVLAARYSDWPVMGAILAAGAFILLSIKPESIHLGPDGIRVDRWWRGRPQPPGQITRIFTTRGSHEHRAVAIQTGRGTSLPFAVNGDTQAFRSALGAALTASGAEGVVEEDARSAIFG